METWADCGNHYLAGITGCKYMNKVSFKEAVGRQNQSENLTDAVLSFAEGIGVIKSYNLLGEKSDELTETSKIKGCQYEV